MLRDLKAYLWALFHQWWALMSCAVFTFISVYVAERGKSSAWFVGATAVAALVFFLVASFLAWRQEHKRAAEERTPKFILESGSIVSHYENGRTLVLVGLRVINAGAPSAVMSYRAEYHSSAGADKMQLVIVGNATLKLKLDGGAGYNFNRSDAINFKTSPIERGGYIAGRLPLQIDGNRVSDIAEGMASITITVTDYLGREYLIECRGTGHKHVPTYMIGEPVSVSQPPTFPGGGRPGRKKRRHKH